MLNKPFSKSGLSKCISISDLVIPSKFNDGINNLFFFAIYSSVKKFDKNLPTHPINTAVNAIHL